MKESIVIPQWALDIMGINEEMSAVQAQNMFGQNLSAEIKAEFKKDPQLMQRTQESVLNIVNGLGVQSGDEKPTLIWVVKQLANGSINLHRLQEDEVNISGTLKLFYKHRRELKKLPEYNYNTLKKDTERFMEGQGVADVKEKPWAQNGEFTILKVTDLKVAMELGKGTKWCTQGERWATQYLGDGPLYVVLKDGKRWAQLHFESCNFMDVWDTPLSQSMINEIKEAFPEQINEVAEAAYNEDPRDRKKCLFFMKVNSTLAKLEAIDEDRTCIGKFEYGEEDAREAANRMPGRGRNGVEFDVDDDKLVVRVLYFSELVDKFNADSNTESDADSYEIETAFNQGFYHAYSPNSVYNRFKNIQKGENIWSQYTNDDNTKIVQDILRLKKHNESLNVDWDCICGDEEVKTVFDHAIDETKRNGEYDSFNEQVDDNVAHYRQEDGSYVFDFSFKHNPVEIIKIYAFGFDDLFTENELFYDGEDSDYDRAYPYFYWDIKRDRKQNKFGFDKDFFNETLKDLLMSLEATSNQIAEKTRKQQRAEGQGDLFDDYMKRVEEKEKNKHKRRKG